MKLVKGNGYISTQYKIFLSGSTPYLDCGDRNPPE